MHNNNTTGTIAIMCTAIILLVGYLVLHQRHIPVEQKAVPAPGAAAPSSHPPQSHAITGNVMEITKSRKALNTWRLEHPDAFYNPGNSSEEYGRNYLRHNQIAQHYYSPIRDHPEMQKLLNLIKQHGYDIMDWVNIVVILTDYHRPVALIRNKLIEAGFHEDEIELQIAEPRQMQEQRIDMYKVEIRQLTGIQDEGFLDTIFNLAMPLDVTKPTMLGRKTLHPGDAFLTDTDW